LWNRRTFLKLSITGLIGATGIFSFLKGYKQKYDILDIIEYPNPNRLLESHLLFLPTTSAISVHPVVP
jgi:hypothetical protein